MNYDQENLESWWYIGPICVSYWNATYSNKFVPKVKPLMLMTDFMTEVFFNKKYFSLIYMLIDGYLEVNYIIGNDVYNAIFFDPDSLNYMQSFTVSLSYQIYSLFLIGATNW